MKDEVVVITGASQKLGRKAAQELARRSARLVLVTDEKTEMESIVGTPGRQTRIATVSLEQSENLDAVVESSIGHFGRVDVLINAASTEPFLRGTLLADLPFEELERMVRINLLAPFRLTQLFLPHLRPGARIVNFSSESAVEHRPGDGGHGAGQAALEHLTRAFALENPAYSYLVVDPGRVEDDSVGAALAEVLSHGAPGYRFCELENSRKAVLTA